MNSHLHPKYMPIRPLAILPCPPHPVIKRSPSPTAEYRQWQPASLEDLQKRHSEIGRFELSPLKLVLEQMVAHQVRERPAATLAQVEEIEKLAARFPSFAEYIEWLAKSLRLSANTEMPVMIRPHLLLGPPGVGKSYIVKLIAEVLNMHFGRLNMPDITANFVLTGSSSNWQNSQPGFIAQNIAAGPPPWLAFDELDKCQYSGDSRYPLLPSLLSMLEVSTAMEWRDECLQFPLDIRPTVFTFTANSLEGIEPALRSRLEIFTIDLPKPNEMPALVHSVDVSIRSDDLRVGMLYRDLCTDVLKAFPPMPARDIQSILNKAYAISCDEYQNSRIELTNSTISTLLEKHISSNNCRRPIGFIS